MNNFQELDIEDNYDDLIVNRKIDIKRLNFGDLIKLLTYHETLDISDVDKILYRLIYINKEKKRKKMFLKLDRINNIKNSLESVNERKIQINTNQNHDISLLYKKLNDINNSINNIKKN